MPGQTYRDLEGALNAGPWYVFHFVGHGGYDRRLDEGTLVLASETGRTQLIGADDISRLLAEHHPLRLVVLNACDTGRGSASDAFSNTAAALIRRGIPAVVAMQFEITDGAAIRFAQTFYEYVAKRRPVDDSVMRARRALRLANKDTLEWGTPVLYLRAPDGRIFDATTVPSLQRALPSNLVPAPEIAALSETSAHQEPPGPPAQPPDEPRGAPHPKLVHTIRHARVDAVVFRSDGHVLETVRSDLVEMEYWDTTTGSRRIGLICRAPGGAALSGWMFSSDGRWLATASDDKTARIWDVITGQELVRFTHDGVVRGVVLSPDGRWLATASSDRTARIWDTVSGQELARVTFDGAVRGVAFSPDGRQLATASDDTARIWALNDED